MTAELQREESEQLPKTGQKFVIVRHGDYAFIDGDDRLTERGKNQALFLSQKIAQFLGPKLMKPGMSVILTSQAVRAKEFAQILGDQLRLRPYVRKLLGDENGKAYTGESIVSDIKNFIDPVGGFRGVVIVTHLEQSEYIPSSLLGVEYRTNRKEGLFKGSAYAIDVDEYREAYLNRFPPSIMGSDYNKELRERQLRLKNSVHILKPNP